MLLLALSICAGPLETLRPYHVADNDLQKLREQVERDKAALAGGGDPSTDKAEDAGGIPEPVAVVATEIARRGLPLGKLSLPIGLAAGATTLILQHRRAATKRLLADLDLEASKLSELTKSTRVERPACTRGALDDLRARTALLEGDLLPKLAQLYEQGKPEQALAGGKPLSQRSVAELEELSSALSERIDASGRLLAEYESLGQPPPPGFRAWPLAELSARLEDMTSKREELREVVRLLTQLGGKRIEWSLPTKSVDELRAYIAELAVKAEEAKERKEHKVLLGKVEAELWRRKEEAPVALGSLTITELQALLKRLRTPGAEAARDEAAARDEDGK